MYVPLRPVVERRGGRVDWDNHSKPTAATIGQWTARFMPAGDPADVNGVTVQFPAPSYVQDGELMVPAEFFHGAHGYQVQAQGQEVSISL